MLGCASRNLFSSGVTVNALLAFCVVDASFLGAGAVGEAVFEHGRKYSGLDKFLFSYLFNIDSCGDWRFALPWGCGGVPDGLDVRGHAGHGAFYSVHVPGHGFYMTACGLGVLSGPFHVFGHALRGPAELAVFVVEAVEMPAHIGVHGMDGLDRHDLRFVGTVEGLSHVGVHRIDGDQCLVLLLFHVRHVVHAEVQPVDDIPGGQFCPYLPKVLEFAGGFPV